MIMPKFTPKRTQAILAHESRSTILANEVLVCGSFWTRLKGLLGTSKLSERKACWIKSCNSIHTVGMKYSIDAYFLDESNRVVSIVKDMKPNRFSKIMVKASSVLEFASGNKTRCHVGDQIKFMEAEA